MDESTAIRKRHAPEADGPRRSKRGKYTAVACDECKKRKLKCVPVDDADCERCIASGLVCVYAPAPLQATKEKNKSSQHQLRNLASEMAQLRQQVADLAGIVKEIKEQPPHSAQCAVSRAPDTAGAGAGAALMPSPSSMQREHDDPKQPQFVGPTRSAFGIMIGERSLTRMGIPTYESLPPSGPPSGAQSPVEPSGDVATDTDYWLRCTPSEVARLLAVFQEEVESVYPIGDINELVKLAPEILHHMKHHRSTDGELAETNLSTHDIDIAKIAMAIGMVVEAPGKTELSTILAESVEIHVSRISSPEVELKEIQLLTILSIYYFLCGEELLAWRTIGIAAREALEMGLHRKKSLFDNFKDPRARHQATRVFWCVYVLDRRWSFGTSLSFALIDRDIDPELPEPDDFSYLKCMIGYGRLCSKLWDAIPPFGAPNQAIPEETVQALDISTLDWLESIPSHLQLRHPRLGLAPRSQPRVIHRIRSLLYLRGNHTRILIYRHYLLSAASITANMRCAWLVVDIAQDTLQVLVHLNATTDIYSRQQTAFNYFLISALAIIFLAVCHAPTVFTAPCRKSFLDAVELVRGFSRNSMASRRLWKSIRGLLPRLRNLGLQSSEEENAVDVAGNRNCAGRDTDTVPVEVANPVAENTTSNVTFGGDTHLNSDIVPDGDVCGSVPDMLQIGNDLLDLFNALGQGQQLPRDFNPQFYGPNESDILLLEEGELARRFQGLI